MLVASVNVDAMDLEELENVIDNGLEGYEGSNATHLQYYAEAAINAKVSRMEGNIEAALAWEENMEHHYDALDVEYRW